MNFYLKILSEAKSRETLKVNGYSGLLYTFKWDSKQRAYVFQPKDQSQVDDIFRTMGRTTSAIFAPVNAPSAAPAATPAAVEAFNATVPVPLDDKLTEQCLFRGVVVTDEDSNDTAKRLIAAYDKGVADTLNSLPTHKPKPRRQQPAAAG